MPESPEDLQRPVAQPSAEGSPRDAPSEATPADPRVPPVPAQPGTPTFSFERTFAFGKQLPADLLSPEALERLRAGGSLSPEELEALRAAVGDPEAALVAGPVRRFSWTLGGQDRDSEAGAVREPATYYEALTGKPDPMRDFFITGRRILNIGTWIIALGIPVGIVLLAVATRQSFETIVWMGIAASIVGIMFKSSFPKTPFG